MSIVVYLDVLGKPCQWDAFFETADGEVLKYSMTVFSPPCGLMANLQRNT